MKNGSARSITDQEKAVWQSENHAIWRAESCVHIEQCLYYLFSTVATEARHGKYTTARIDPVMNQISSFLTHINSANRIDGVRVRGL